MCPNCLAKGAYFDLLPLPQLRQAHTKMAISPPSILGGSMLNRKSPNFRLKVKIIPLGSYPYIQSAELS